MATSSRIKKLPKNVNAFERKPDLQKEDVVYDMYEISREAANMVRNSTGIIYCNEMIEHKCLWNPDHPECPGRFIDIIKRCEELQLLDRCERISVRLADYSELILKHSSDLINILRKTENCQDVHLLEHISSRYDSIFIHPTTYKLALKAVGSAIELVDAICKCKIQNGMAIIRPPGHHAMESAYCGFCFFNNVAIAAEHVLKNCGISKLLIVDWDVHHGQGTQQMFYDDPRYENGTFWPNLRESDYDFIGKGAGKGFNFNIPLNKTGMGNEDYMAVFHNILLPMVTEFQPEVILISAGYDAALGCPEGEMKVTPACYAHLLTSLSGFANGKIAVILEGGYCLKSLAEGASLTLRALLGDPCPMIGPLHKPSESISETILNVIYAQRNYWNCFKLQGSYSIHNIDSDDSAIRKHLPTIKFLFDEEYPTVFETKSYYYPVQDKQFLDDINSQLNHLILTTKLLCPSHKVCFVYDESMLEHRNISISDHPEKPERISEIYAMFEDYKLLNRLNRLTSRFADEDELLLVHEADYVKKIRELKSITNIKELNKQAKKYSSVYFHQKSYNSACIAAGSLLQVVDSVLNGESASGIAVIRPPGHHANDEEACGFCIFNNVAIAAKYAINTYGLKRVLILDWDIHHGNGTQQIFQCDPQVLYMSLHRYENGRFFPCLQEGGHKFVGKDSGMGFNVNIPWSEKGMGNGEYCSAFFHIILPIAYQFNPELILISAGFDAAIGDPLGGNKITPDAYAHFTHWLMPLANGRVILSLEGGYNVKSVSYSLTMCAKALLDDPLPVSQFNNNVKRSAITTLKKVIETHSVYWSCLNFIANFPIEDVLPNPEEVICDSNKNKSSATAKTDVIDDVTTLLANWSVTPDSSDNIVKEMET